MQDYEKLGVFYLGRDYDMGAKKLLEDLVLYDSKDLVTHAVVVGMTGSGKTGLCIDMIEEAAIDGIPSILVDPKGDLANLLLTFPQLQGQDFQPWVNEDDANRKGLSIPDFGAQQAGLWQKGLSDWGEGGDRIQRLRNAADFVIYTPGSSAGIQVSILKSFAVPPDEVREDGELFQNRISTTVSSLLGLAGIDSDPLQGREHILLSTIIGQNWKQGQSVDLATLIQQVQNPPVTRIGVLEVESFYPPKERFSLVMALNNLLASPAFSSWMEGVPLDIGEILHTPQGKPRVAIFSIAHLSDTERMFFVSLLLNQIVGWMRTQTGTTSLRALFYMDEIFGYFPPIQNPPSKLPLLTMLKQARAYGLGVILATQNPVDLDYKGLSNTGTWFVGRLQTERDKARLMDGLEGATAAAGASFDRAQMDAIISGLGNRVFLMNNTHQDVPVVFQTRWSLSYLRGPLSREQIKRLMDPYKLAQGATASPALANTVVKTQTAAFTVKAASAEPAAASSGGLQPTLPSDIQQFFAPVRTRSGADQTLLYQPTLIGAARIRFLNAKSGTDLSQDCAYITAITDQAVPVNWDDAQEVTFAINDLQKTAASEADFDVLPAQAGSAKNYLAWARGFSTWVFGQSKLDLLRSPSTSQVSKPAESEKDFRLRLQQSFREQRDAATEALKLKYAAKTASLEAKVRSAQNAVDREESQAQGAKLQTAISLGSTILGAFLGGGRSMVNRSVLGRATTTVRGVGRSVQQGQDVTRPKADLEVVQQQLQELQDQFNQEVAALQAKIDPQNEVFETLTLRPKKTDVTVQLASLLWVPTWQDKLGNTTQAW
jgi:hypothetical protein